MKKKQASSTDENIFKPRTSTDHRCSADSIHQTCEKFFQIWSHKATNISNDLIEYTMRRIQIDRLNTLFQTRREYSREEKIQPICHIPKYTESELQRNKEQIRRFCLMTRNLYRHLRSDSRLYPEMCIELDQGITMKICRFIFKVKVLMKIFPKEHHLDESQKKHIDSDDPYRNVTKAFVILHSNFEILFGDIVDRDFFENAKTAVQTLPIILDINKTIRLIYCLLYKLNEPERQAEAKAIRQRRTKFCDEKRGITKAADHENRYSLVYPTSPQPISTRTIDSIPTAVAKKLVEQPIKHLKETEKLKKKLSNSSKASVTRSRSYDQKSKKSKSSQRLMTESQSSRKSKIVKSIRSSSKTSRRSTRQNTPTKSRKQSKNKNCSVTPSVQSSVSTEMAKSDNDIANWTTWIQNATQRLAAISTTAVSHKPQLTSWASLNRQSKQLEKSNHDQMNLTDS